MKMTVFIGLLVLGMIPVVQALSLTKGEARIEAIKIDNTELDVPFIYSNGVITVDTKNADLSQMKEATVYLPKAREGIFVPTVLVKDDACKKEPCWKKADVRLKLEKDHYKFTVDHFSSYYVNDSMNFTTIQDCFNQINNTGDACVMQKSNYSESFVNRTSYNLSAAYALIMIGQDNLWIDFNKTYVYTLYNFVSVSEGLNHTWLNLVVNTSGDVYGGGTGLRGNWTFINITSDQATKFTNFGTGNPDSTINFSDCRISSYISAYASNLWMNNCTMQGTITLGFPYTRDYINNSRILDTIIYITASGKGNVTLTNNQMGSTYIHPANNAFHDWLIANNSFNGLTDNDVLRIMDGSTNVTIENNTFIDCGNKTETSNYLSSYSPLTYGGDDFNGGMAYISSDLGTSAAVSSDDTDVSKVVSGQASIRLWLIDAPGAGISYATLYVVEPPIMSCAAIAGAYGGTCFLDEADYWTYNSTTQNYDVNPATASSVMAGYTDPPYLVNNSFYLYYYAAVNLTSSTGNIIKGNTFTGQHPLYSESTTNNVSLNNFYESEPYGTADYCISNQGNFYEQNLSVPSGDCGQAGIFTQHFIQDCTTQYLQWTPQTAIQNMSYHVLHHNGTSYKYIGRTNNTYMNISSALMTGTDIFTLIPFDDITNATIDDTNVTLSNSTGLYPRSYSWMRPPKTTICEV